MAMLFLPMIGKRRDGWRWGLASLLAFLAMNAFAGSYYGISGAKGVPKEWLAGSPFRDYFIPSLILGIVVGGSLLAAAIAVFRSWPSGHLLTLAAGVIVLGWLTVETAIIGYVSWLQPVTALLAFVVLALAFIVKCRSL